MKKLLSIFLSALFIFGMIPISAFTVFAEEECRTEAAPDYEPESGAAVAEESPKALPAIGAAPEPAESESGYYTYEVYDGEATITGCDQSISGTVAIPSTLGGYPVTVIGEVAFYGCSSLTGITIPDSVICIGRRAFENCSSLTDITVPDSVTAIGSYAFWDCSSLTGITLPDSVTSIGSRAFDATAWYNNQPGGVVYAGKVAYKYKGTMLANMSISLKEGTKGISGYAFSGCTGLTNITIPGSVTTIEDGAFYGCSGLTSITVPDGVTGIGNETFQYCSSLTGLTIPGSVTVIGSYAFYSCEALKDVYYDGTESQWDVINIDEGNEPLFGAVIHYTGAQQNPFKDIPETSWYTDACLWCNERGYITGTGDDTFNPSGTLTRAQFVQILAKVDGVDLNAVKYSGKFTDVKDGVWYARAVQWAVDCGVTGGTGDKTFSPDSAVSREQLATFFMAYAGYKGYDVSAAASLEKYTDAGTIAAWAKSAVTWAIAEGLISGTGDTAISPKKSATRAQAAVIFKNFEINYLKKGGSGFEKFSS